MTTATIPEKPDADLEPIRPEHATHGWQLEEDRIGRWLSKPMPDGGHVRIRPISPTTCLWSVLSARGRTVYVGAPTDVDAAKRDADRWICRGHR